MPARPEDLFALLDRLGVAHETHRHRPIFTVAEGEDIKARLPGGHSKNLFLKDKKGDLALVCALGETKIDLNALARALRWGRPSFGSAALMEDALGVSPGSVTVFALMNDAARQVRLVLDEALLCAHPLNFHPLTNNATTAISAAGLARFLAHTGHAPIRVAFDAEGRPTMIAEPG